MKLSVIQSREVLSHQLPYGGVPLYRVDFESQVSLKQGVISSNFPEIWYYFGIRAASGARDYEIFPKIGYVFGARLSLK